MMGCNDYGDDGGAGSEEIMVGCNDDDVGNGNSNNRGGDGVAKERGVMIMMVLTVTV